MAAAKKQVKRSVNLRRQRRSTVTGFDPGDKVIAEWDREKWEWRLLIESANGIQIDHERLTSDKGTA